MNSFWSIRFRTRIRWIEVSSRIRFRWRRRRTRRQINRIDIDIDIRWWTDLRNSSKWTQTISIEFTSKKKTTSIFLLIFISKSFTSKIFSNFFRIKTFSKIKKRSKREISFIFTRCWWRISFWNSFSMKILNDRRGFESIWNCFIDRKMSLILVVDFNKNSIRFDSIRWSLFSRLTKWKWKWKFPNRTKPRWFSCQSIESNRMSLTSRSEGKDFKELIRPIEKISLEENSSSRIDRCSSMSRNVQRISKEFERIHLDFDREDKDEEKSSKKISLKKKTIDRRQRSTPYPIPSNKFRFSFLFFVFSFSKKCFRWRNVFRRLDAIDHLSSSSVSSISSSKRIFSLRLRLRLRFRLRLGKEFDFVDQRSVPIVARRSSIFKWVESNRIESNWK